MHIKPKIIIGSRPKGKVWFMSDLHYGHFNAIRHGNRPFTTLEEMNEYIRKEITEKVGPEDYLFDLGDLFWRADYEEIEKFANILPGPILLHTQGNHDNENVWKFQPLAQKTKALGDIFDVHISDGEEDYSLVLSHYPILSWSRRGHGSANIHGHCHGNIDSLNTSSLELRMDIGFDSSLAKEIGSFLVPWEIIKKKINEIIEKRNLIKTYELQEL